MELYLTKTHVGLIHTDEIAAEALDKYPNGTTILCKLVQPRNAKFHRKFFALLTVGFRYWEPGEVSSKYGKPEKNFDQFRNDVIILAGFYTVETRLDGSVRINAKSISFANMTEDDFAQLYSKVIDVLLKHVFVGYSEDEVLRMAEREILDFA